MKPRAKKTQQRSECGHEAVRSEWKAFRRSAERNRERRDRGICKGRTELAESQVKGASRRRRKYCRMKGMNKVNEEEALGGAK